MSEALDELFLRHLRICFQNLTYNSGKGLIKLPAFPADIGMHDQIIANRPQQKDKRQEHDKALYILIPKRIHLYLCFLPDPCFLKLSYAPV